MNISETQWGRAGVGLVAGVKMSRHRTKAGWEMHSERNLGCGWKGPGRCGCV